MEETEYVESGIPGLDRILQGGLPRNQMYAVYGTSGSGKTTLCMQYLLHGIKSGERSGFGISTAPFPFEVSYVSDAVINLGYFEFRGTVHKALSVFKKRSGNHERTIRELTMDDNGLHVGPVLRDFEGIATGIPRYTGEALRGDNSY